MTTALVIVLVDRPVRTQPDHPAFAACGARGDTGRQLLKLRLEPVQPVRSQRLRRQADQLVELALVVRADRHEHPIGQRAHRLAGFSGDSAEIVPCGSDDTLRVRDATGREQVLPFEGQWGWGHQDVQINLSAVPLAPHFFADTERTTSRAVTGAQPRASTRAGDVICHRGERTGYSCSVVELTDFAPAGDLCGGACLPTWITVAGPTCKSGDSGGPVFLGTTAHGIVKGGGYRADGSCAFYFYMSTDYLPTGWQLLTADPSLSQHERTAEFGMVHGVH